ncbi:hypothetical protein JHK85_001731 [Glycine max]|nr:hypothetical protein JHK85_001731 [Glycine max]KAG5089079.1 hypothetical protein JHK86_001691 [Glycine max]
MEEKSMAMAVTNKKAKISNKNILDDLAFFVRSKLPLKSLKRSGCVRKSWSLLFENSHFMIMHRNNFLSNNYSHYDDTSAILQHLAPFSTMGEFDSSLYLLSGERFEKRVMLDWPPHFKRILVIQHVTFFALNDHDLDDLSVSWEDTSLDLVWEIYSLRSNSWKKLDVDIPKCYHEMEDLHPRSSRWQTKYGTIVVSFGSICSSPPYVGIWTIHPNCE